MRIKTLATILLASGGAAMPAMAEHHEALIESALSAAPPSVADEATIKDAAGNMLREGSNEWTCYPETPGLGPMCNSGEWDALMAALGAKSDFTPTRVSMSYMLAGEGDAPGTSNISPYEAGPTEDNDWIKDGPHLMIILPDPAALEGISTDPKDPVYVMWKGTPYAHLMVRIAEPPAE